MSDHIPTHTELYERMGVVVGKIDGLYQLIQQSNARHDRIDDTLIVYGTRIGALEANSVPRAEIAREKHEQDDRIQSLEASRARLRGVLVAIGAVATIAGAVTGAVLSRWLLGLFGMGGSPPPSP